MVLQRGPVYTVNFCYLTRVSRNFIYKLPCTRILAINMQRLGVRRVKRGEEKIAGQTIRMVHFAWTANISPELYMKERPVEETVVSLSFHLFFSSRLYSTQFNRILPRIRVFVRHYRDRVAVYRSRASHRYFLQFEFHTSHSTLQPPSPTGF